ncbi:hypothetical protein FBU30_004342 [Linnemannia zychae]|nr:hypothetical protein FBU30_004342 [Linnemannia zychae]
MAQYTLTNTQYLVVVVTGCDTGFGAEIVHELYQRGGYTIYATCLTNEAVERYHAKESTRLRSIKLDVTNQEDVNRLRAQIEAECPQGVYCVLNNAGINGGSLIDLTSEDMFERVMNVNYMGIVRITKALLPSLRIYAKSRHTLPDGSKLPRARLVSITSVAGRINSPGLGPYCASKHAAESILDTLRVELAPWEIDVSMIEPFFAKTAIMTNSSIAFERDWNLASDQVHHMYGQAFVEGTKKHNQLLYEQAMPPQWVVQAAVNAVHKKNGAQKARVLIGFCTGFGAGIVNDLYQLGGYTIYATCSSEKTLESYKGRESDRLRPIKVDVTVREDVNRLRERIEAECPQGIYCVVNNAGINNGGWVDLTTEEVFERVMNVNYMGLIRITKALIPSLRVYAKSRHTLPEGQSLPRARLIGMSSIAARLNSIGLGPYTASKKAAESILDTLRLELSPWEIDVQTIEPGYAKTPIITKAISSLEQEWVQADKGVREMYGDKFIETALRDQRTIYESAMPAQWTVKATVDAVHKEDGASKHARVLIGQKSANFVIRLLEMLPGWIVDAMMRAGMKKTGYWAADPFLLKESEGEGDKGNKKD